MNRKEKALRVRDEYIRKMNVNVEKARRERMREAIDTVTAEIIPERVGYTVRLYPFFDRFRFTKAGATRTARRMIAARIRQLKRELYALENTETVR